MLLLSIAAETFGFFKMCCESDERFCRRTTGCIRGYQESSRLPDLDVVVLTRIYRYAGHVIRSHKYSPDSLVPGILHYRSRPENRDIGGSLGHQGHPGRGALNFGFDFFIDRLFRSKDLDWAKTAPFALDWHYHELDFIKFKLGNRVKKSLFGKVQH